MSRVVLLGPQRFEPNLASTLDALGCGEPVAVITAGWREREEETDELRGHVGRELVNLALYRRAEQVHAEDTELAGAMRARQDRLQSIQELYRARLERGLDAAREMLAWPGRGPAVEEHRRAAIRAVRTIDRQHLVQVRAIQAEFEERWNPVARDAVRRQRERMARELEGCAALAIAGGHVAVLLNRLLLFDPTALLSGVPLVAWSAGAMAVCERVVLFHDTPPQGPGDAELLQPGLALCRGVVPLPHASQRLRLGDPLRVGLMARRFAPALCVPLEAGARVDREDGRWVPGAGVQVLGRQGALRPMATR